MPRVTKVESEYDTGWREGYEAASGNATTLREALGDYIDKHSCRHYDCPEWIAVMLALGSPKKSSSSTPRR